MNLNHGSWHSVKKNELLANFEKSLDSNGKNQEYCQYLR